MTRIIVAPFSNSDIRDWPADHYAALIGDLVDGLSRQVRIGVVGTRNQKQRACAIVRDHDPVLVRNECGRLPWPAVIEQVRSADLVIGNNSGLVHLAGYHGVPTLCLFGGAHQRLEWHALGASVTTLSRTIGCSPCHLDHDSGCPYDKACLRQILPSTAAGVALDMIARAGSPPGGDY